MPVCRFGGAKCEAGPNPAGPIELVVQHEQMFHGLKAMPKNSTDHIESSMPIGKNPKGFSPSRKRSLYSLQTASRKAKIINKAKESRVERLKRDY